MSPAAESTGGFRSASPAGTAARGRTVDAGSSMRPDRHLCLLGDANSVHLQRWAAEMQVRGFRVSVVTARPASVAGAEQRVLAPVATSRDWLFRVAAARRAVAELAPDIVHAHYVTSYGYLGARIGRHPLVMTAWGSDLLVTPRDSRIVRWITGWTIRRADLVTGDSTDLLDAAAAYRPSAPCRLVHWGADLAKFRPTDWAVKRGFQIASLRSWEPNYRIDLIVAAFARLVAAARTDATPATSADRATDDALARAAGRSDGERPTRSAPHLHLLGGGSLEGTLREQVARLGVSAHVSFHGRVDDAAMAAVLAACKVSVSMPRSDATSVSVLESMAAGLAVVASDLPANRPWLAAADPALLVPSGDADALFAALDALRRDDARAAAVGRRHRETMEREGGRAVQMDRMAALYDALLAGRPILSEHPGSRHAPGPSAGPPQAGPHPLGGSAGVPIDRGAVASGPSAGPPQPGPHPLGGSADVPIGRGAVVSVIVPCRNEARFIEPFCAGVLRQRLPTGWSLQLVIADGQSDDGTRARLEAMAAAEPRIEWIENPARIVSAGLNRALRCARGEVVARMDVHSDYADDYLAECLAALAATGADNVGGPWHAEPQADAGPTQRAVAAAFQSRWVAGGARSRSLDHDGWVDTVYLGCWPRAAIERFGGFDESLVRNQDDEHNLRIVRGGGRIWQSAAIRSAYRPRAALAQVFRQYLQYGYWKPFVMKKHGQAASVRHLVPGAFVALLAIAAVVALLGGPRWPVGTLAGAYLVAVAGLTVAVVRASRLDVASTARVPLVVMAYHLGYGIGSIFGAWDAARHGEGRARFASLTR